MHWGAPPSLANERLPTDQNDSEGPGCHALISNTSLNEIERPVHDLQGCSMIYLYWSINMEKCCEIAWKWYDDASLSWHHNWCIHSRSTAAVSLPNTAPPRRGDPGLGVKTLTLLLLSVSSCCPTWKNLMVLTRGESNGFHLRACYSVMVGTERRLAARLCVACELRLRPPKWNTWCRGKANKWAFLWFRRQKADDSRWFPHTCVPICMSASTDARAHIHEHELMLVSVLAYAHIQDN